MRQRDNLYYWGIRVVCASDGEEGGEGGGGGGGDTVNQLIYNQGKAWV